MTDPSAIWLRYAECFPRNFREMGLLDLSALFERASSPSIWSNLWYLLRLGELKLHLPKCYAGYENSLYLVWLEELARRDDPRPSIGSTLDSQCRCVFDLVRRGEYDRLVPFLTECTGGHWSAGEIQALHSFLSDDWTTYCKTVMTVLRDKDSDKQQLYRALAGHRKDINALLRIPNSEEDKMWVTLFVGLCEFRQNPDTPPNRQFEPYGVPLFRVYDQFLSDKLTCSGSEDERAFFFHLSYCHSSPVLRDHPVGYDAVNRCCAAGYVAAASAYRDAVGMPDPPDEVAAAIAEYKKGNPRVHRDLFLTRLKEVVDVDLTETAMWAFFCEDLDEDAEAMSKEWLKSQTNRRQSPINDDPDEASDVAFWRQIFKLSALTKATPRDRRQRKKIRKICVEVFKIIYAIAEDEQSRSRCRFLAHATKRVVDAFASCYNK
jgi:hypothetical protein